MSSPLWSNEEFGVSEFLNDMDLGDLGAMDFDFGGLDIDPLLDFSALDDVATGLQFGAEPEPEVEGAVVEPAPAPKTANAIASTTEEAATTETATTTTTAEPATTSTGNESGSGPRKNAQGKFTRSRDGCNQCRNSKIKCCLKKPNCSNCDRKSLPCSYIRLPPPGFHENPVTRAWVKDPPPGTATTASSSNGINNTTATYIFNNSGNINMNGNITALPMRMRMNPVSQPGPPFIPVDGNRDPPEPDPMAYQNIAAAAGVPMPGFMPAPIPAPMAAPMVAPAPLPAPAPVMAEQQQEYQQQGVGEVEGYIVPLGPGGKRLTFGDYFWGEEWEWEWHDHPEAAGIVWGGEEEEDIGNVLGAQEGAFDEGEMAGLLRLLEGEGEAGGQQQQGQQQPYQQQYFAPLPSSVPQFVPALVLTAPTPQSQQLPLQHQQQQFVALPSPLPQFTPASTPTVPTPRAQQQHQQPAALPAPIPRPAPALTPAVPAPPPQQQLPVAAPPAPHPQPLTATPTSVRAFTSCLLLPGMTPPTPATLTPMAVNPAATTVINPFAIADRARPETPGAPSEEVDALSGDVRTPPGLFNEDEEEEDEELEGMLEGALVGGAASMTADNANNANTTATIAPPAPATDADIEQALMNALLADMEDDTPAPAAKSDNGNDNAATTAPAPLQEEGGNVNGLEFASFRDVEWAKFESEFLEGVGWE